MKLFFYTRRKETKADNTVFLQHGEPLIFGKESEKGIRLNGFQPEVTTVTNGTDDLIVHDQYAENTTLANFLARMSDMPEMPHPIGIFRSVQHTCYEDMMTGADCRSKTAKRRRRSRSTPQCWEYVGCGVTHLLSRKKRLNRRRPWRISMTFCGKVP